MELTPFEIDDDKYYIGQIIMIPDKERKTNSFYKIIKFSNKMLYTKKMKVDTTLVKYDDKEMTKTYEAKITDEFENNESNNYKMVKKTSVNKKYPIIICCVVKYEV